MCERIGGCPPAAAAASACGQRDCTRDATCSASRAGGPSYSSSTRYAPPDPSGPGWAGPSDLDITSALQTPRSRHPRDTSACAPTNSLHRRGGRCSMNVSPPVRSSGLVGRRACGVQGVGGMTFGADVRASGKVRAGGRVARATHRTPRRRDDTAAGAPPSSGSSSRTRSARARLRSVEEHRTGGLTRPGARVRPRETSAALAPYPASTSQMTCPCRGQHAEVCVVRADGARPDRVSEVPHRPLECVGKGLPLRGIEPKLLQ